MLLRKRCYYSSNYFLSNRYKIKLSQFISNLHIFAAKWHRKLGPLWKNSRLTRKNFHVLHTNQRFYCAQFVVTQKLSLTGGQLCGHHTRDRETSFSKNFKKKKRNNRLLQIESSLNRHHFHTRSLIY